MRRLFRRFLVNGRHSCDRLADVVDFIDCKNMLVLDGIAIPACRHVFGKNYSFHAGMPLRFFHVDAQTFPVRYRTS